MPQQCRHGSGSGEPHGRRPNTTTRRRRRRQRRVVETRSAVAVVVAPLRAVEVRAPKPVVAITYYSVQSVLFI